MSHRRGSGWNCARRCTSRRSRSRSSGSSRNGKLEETSIGNLLQVATVFHHYLPEARTARPPAIVQRVGLGLLAAIGRRHGFTPHPTHGHTK